MYIIFLKEEFMNKTLHDLFAGKSVCLLGAGVSNMPLCEYIAPVVRSLTVRDKKSEDELGETAEKIKSLGARLITGPNYMDDICENIVFRSPGIRPDTPELIAARKRGSTVTSEMELFLSLHPCSVYAVTGSDGKTTTTTLTSLMLEAGGEGKVFLGGNIGKPMLHRLDDITPADSAAIEVSSFQLMTVDAPVDVAAITNITPNHLNWHASMEEYIEAKKRILKKCGRAVLNFDNEETRKIAFEIQKNTDIPITFFSLSPLPEGLLREIDSAVWLENDSIYSLFPADGKQKILDRSVIKIPGLHNTANYITAIAVTYGRVSPDKIENIARTFGGVEHRLEFVREKDGVTFINGSIDSSPTRTAAALSAISDRPVVLIAGGYDKHIPYEPLADAIFSSSVHSVVLCGQTGEKIYDAIFSSPKYTDDVKKTLKIVREPDFEKAVRTAAEIASPGDTVILSPASASFDAFLNFEVRGRRFKEIVNSL